VGSSLFGRLKYGGQGLARSGYLHERATGMLPPKHCEGIAGALSHYRIFDAGNFASLKSRRGDGFVPCLHRRGPEGSVRFA